MGFFCNVGRLDAWQQLNNNIFHYSIFFWTLIKVGSTVKDMFKSTNPLNVLLKNILSFEKGKDWF